MDNAYIDVFVISSVIAAAMLALTHCDHRLNSSVEAGHMGTEVCARWGGINRLTLPSMPRNTVT